MAFLPHGNDKRWRFLDKFSTKWRFRSFSIVCVYVWTVKMKENLYLWTDLCRRREPKIFSRTSDRFQCVGKGACCKFSRYSLFSFIEGWKKSSESLRTRESPITNKQSLLPSRIKSSGELISITKIVHPTAVLNVGLEVNLQKTQKCKSLRSLSPARLVMAGKFFG